MLELNQPKNEQQKTEQFICHNKSLHMEVIAVLHYNHNNVSFMRVWFMLVFHPSKCISAIKRTLFNYRHIFTFVFFHSFVCFLLLLLWTQVTIT